MGTKRVLDYNPVSGRTVWFEYDHALEKVIITHSGDAEPALRKAEALRQYSAERTAKGIKEDMVHYAIVPQEIQLEMKEKYGVDFWNREHDAKVFDLLNTVYKRFKVTEINHSVKSSD